VFAEETGKVRGIGKRKLVRDVLDRLRGEYQLALGFGEQALTDEVTGGDAGRALDVIVEPIDRHAELFGLEAELMLAAEKFVDQRPKLRDGGISRLQGDAARAGAARRKPRDTDSNERQQAAHRHPIAFARQAPLLEQLEAKRRKPRTLRLAADGNDRMCRNSRSRDSASPARSASAMAASSVKVMTQPSVAFGRKRKPWATAAGTRMAAGAAKASFAASYVIVTAAPLDQKNLKQIAMPVRADCPVMDGRARSDLLDMDKIKRLIVGRIAVKMEQG
jgi:hypothetical protein